MTLAQWCHGSSLGADPEETILNAFKVFDPEGKGTLKKELWVEPLRTLTLSEVNVSGPLITTACVHSVTEMLTTQADRFSPEEVRAPPVIVPSDTGVDLLLNC